MPEMKVYQREHFERKVDTLLNPQIEKEELLLSSTVAEMTEAAEKKLAKKIGADTIMSNLEKTREEYEKAQHKARIFFRANSRKSVIYKNTLDYDFEYKENTEITVQKCRNQIRKWAEAFAREEAEKLDVGRKITYLKAIKTSAKDSIMEAHVGIDLKTSLDKLLQPLGIAWQRPIPALPKPTKNGA